jgi:hypothetical protein
MNGHIREYHQAAALTAVASPILAARRQQVQPNYKPFKHTALSLFRIVSRAHYFFPHEDKAGVCIR